MNAGQLDQLTRIVALMDEMHRHYWARDPQSSGKSDDGWIELHLGSTRTREEGRGEVHVEISHSYFVPGRRKLFSSPYIALREVKQWHTEEMKRTGPDKGMWE